MFARYSAAALLAAIVSTSATAGPIDFVAELDSSQVVAGSTNSATGIATFTLSEDKSMLSYDIQLSDDIFLSTSPASETDPAGVDKIHLHFAPAGTVGPHVLNIFGLPGEDDADFAVDFMANRITGIWDDSDATGDPNAGGSSKLLSLFVDELEAGNIYLAVHTVGNGGGVAIRGQLAQVPAPAGITLLGLGLAGLMARRRRTA